MRADSPIEIKAGSLVGFALTLILAIGGSAFTIYQGVSEKITVHDEKINNIRELSDERISNIREQLDRLEANDRAIIEKLDRIKK